MEVKTYDHTVFARRYGKGAPLLMVLAGAPSTISTAI
jgi:hypothetical protein